MALKRKIYSIFCYISITLGIILIIFTFIELFLFTIIFSGNIAKILYVIFLGIGGITSIVGGLFSLGILPIIGCSPCFVSMLLLLNDTTFYESYRYNVLLVVIITLLFGVLLIIFYSDKKEEIKPEITELSLNNLKDIKRKEIEKLNMIGVETIEDLIDERENIKEVSKITDIKRSKIRKWIKEAEGYQKELIEYQKKKLKKSYWKKRKKKK
ncbi:MAG: hypothetical protein GF329_21365 [Candidatus Lokiarchaeota archaeon]|nr:hypothetical protein [Candidatus Lokiarchaeota archaeon]